MRNRHHTKKGPGRVHWQGFERGDREVIRSFENGKLLDQIETVQRFVNQHPKGVLGRIARWRLQKLEQERVR